jgi:hypothetical protein
LIELPQEALQQLLGTGVIMLLMSTWWLPVQRICSTDGHFCARSE